MNMLGSNSQLFKILAPEEINMALIFEMSFLRHSSDKTWDKSLYGESLGVLKYAPT